MGKDKAKGKAKASEPEAPKESKKRGRPKGAKDKKPRAPRSASKVAWIYEGAEAAKGRQVATIGAAIRHDGIGLAILLEQTDLDHLKLQSIGERRELVVVFNLQAEPAAVLACDGGQLQEGARWVISPAD